MEFEATPTRQLILPHPLHDTYTHIDSTVGATIVQLDPTTRKAEDGYTLLYITRKDGSRIDHRLTFVKKCLSFKIESGG